MEWNDFATNLIELEGKSVDVTIGELAGAGAVVAWFSGPLQIQERENPQSEGELFVMQVGEDGMVRLERSLADLVEGGRDGFRVAQGTLYVDLHLLDRPAAT